MSDILNEMIQNIVFDQIEKIDLKTCSKEVSKFKKIIDQNNSKEGLIGLKSDKDFLDLYEKVQKELKITIDNFTIDEFNGSISGAFEHK